jgi:broad specificity phosphatase PhoE
MGSMSPVALLRHGQAASDSVDSRALTDAGREEAIAAARFLEPLCIARAVASGTSRARETAALLRPALGTGVEAGLAGLRIGGAETPLRGVEALHVPFETPYSRPLGGESLRDLQRRATAALRRLAGTPVAVAAVAHRFVNTVVLAGVLDLDLGTADVLLQDTGAVNLIAGVGPEARLVAMNVSPADLMRTGARGTLLPDTEVRVERRLYLVSAGAPGATPNAAEVTARAATGALAGELEVELQVAYPADVAATCTRLLGLDPALAERLPSAAGTVSILDRAAGRWWARCLGWDPGGPI